MAKRKIFGPQYPISIEREYLRFLNLYANAYNKLLRDGLADIMPGMKEIAGQEQLRVDDFADDISKLFKFVNSKMAVRFTDEVLRRAAKSMVGKSSKYSKKQLAKIIDKHDEGKELHIEPLLTDRGMNPYFQNIVEQNVSLIKSIPEYSQTRMKETLIAMLTKDATNKEIQAVLMKGFKLTKGRAAFIARDQVGKLNGSLEQHRQRQLGITRYIWRTSEDARVRKDHEKLDGKTFYWNKPPVVDRATGRRGNPKEDFQCRCWAEPIIEDIIET